MGKTKQASSRGDKRYIYRSANSNSVKAWNDLTEGFSMAPMWGPLTLREMFGKFRRQFLGILWIPLGTMIVVFLLGYAYAQIFAVPYLPFCLYLFAGLLTWQVIQPAITGGFGLYTRQANVIANVRIPYSYWIYKYVFELMIGYALVLPVYFIFMAVLLSAGIVPEMNWAAMIWYLPAMALYIVTAFCVVMFLAVVSIRVRDLEAPVTSMMRILFLVTPIIWKVEGRAEGSFRAEFVQYNPFYHLLQIGRAPLLGEIAEPINWYVSLGVMGLFIVLALLVFMRARHRILYWL